MTPSLISLDCREAADCASNAMNPTTARPQYWIDEAQVYDLDTIGTDPFGFCWSGHAQL